jgi:hypothetical protein
LGLEPKILRAAAAFSVRCCDAERFVVCGREKKNNKLKKDGRRKTLKTVGKERPVQAERSAVMCV